METLNSLLDKARKACDRDSDRAIAMKLRVTAQSVSVWRKGGKITDTHLMSLIELAQADPALAVKVRQEEAGTPAERKAWSALWDRLSPVTTVIGGLALAVFLAPGAAKANPVVIQSLATADHGSLYIMFQKVRTWLSHRMRQALMPPLHRRQYA
jgi:hypothetical protein